jgi:uncharacterized DUF497 family protein
MQFEWDPSKAAANIAKHGVSFTLAQEVWDDPLHVVIPERVTEGEERWQAFGVVGGVTLLVLAHTYRDRLGEEVIRIIGARRATKHERRYYENEA